MSFRTRRDGRVFPVRGSSKNRSVRMSKSSLPSAGIRHEGALEAHGYNLEEGEDARHESLRKGVEQDGYATTVERVNALAVLNKNHPTNHGKLESDLGWLHEKYRGGTTRSKYVVVSHRSSHTVTASDSKEAEEAFKERFPYATIRQVTKVTSEKNPSTHGFILSTSTSENGRFR